MFYFYALFTDFLDYKFYLANFLCFTCFLPCSVVLLMWMFFVTFFGRQKLKRCVVYTDIQ